MVVKDTQLRMCRTTVTSRHKKNFTKEEFHEECSTNKDSMVLWFPTYVVLKDGNLQFSFCLFFLCFLDHRQGSYIM